MSMLMPMLTRKLMLMPMQQEKNFPVGGTARGTAKESERREQSRLLMVGKYVKKAD